MLVDTGKIVVRDRIRKDFGDIEELAKDIKENGLINPPVVTPDMELIAGERRLRAMKSLGYAQVEVRVMTVQDALHQLKLEISENENRKEFSFSEKMEWADRLKEEYRKIAEANSHAGTTGTDVTLVGRVDDKVAEQTGLGSREKLRKAEYIKEHADEEMIRQLDEGQLSINAAFVTLKNKLKEVEAERDNFAQEAVEACKAVQASTDSEEYMRMAEKVRKLEEQQRIDFEKQQLKDKEDRETRQKAAAERKAEIDKIKADAEAQVKLAQDQMEKANKALAEAPKEGKKSSKKEIVEVAPDDYEEVKAELARLKASQPHKNIRSVKIDETEEQRAIEYYNFLNTSAGTFLSDMEGFAIQKEFCIPIAPEKKAFLAENLRTIMNRCAEIIDFIKECNSKEVA
jgi:ParB family transcriptional regulator, chromosome partitioning protein